MPDDNIIDIEMRPILEAARDRGLMLWCRYLNLWFTPDELEFHQKKLGQFRWGACNWELVSTDDYVELAKASAGAANQELARRIERVAAIRALKEKT